MASNKIKIVTVLGARPQIIKAAAINCAIQAKFSESISEVIVHTGQHYDENMSAVFFNELQLPKENYNLKVGCCVFAIFFDLFSSAVCCCCLWYFC